jgi:ankyrin repeat protein
MAARSENSGLLTAILSSGGFSGEENPTWDFMTLDFLALDNDVETIGPPPAVVSRIELNGADRNGLTPLLAAVEAGALANCAILLGVDGVNKNARDRSGHSAVHLAAMHGRSEIIKELLAAGGVDVNAKDREGVRFVAI